MSREILGFLDADIFATVQEFKLWATLSTRNVCFGLNKDELGHIVERMTRLARRGLNQREGEDYSKPDFCPNDLWYSCAFADCDSLRFVFCILCRFGVYSRRSFQYNLN